MKAKTKKQRGSRTHGWGAGKKHRGAGHRGGRGKAGSGKRGQQKETYYLSKGIKTLGGRDLLKPKSKPDNIINLGQIEKRIKSWETKKLLKKEKGVTVVDLKKLGYDKLLGYGELKKSKLKIIVDKISLSARKKLGMKVSGGSSAEAGESPRGGTTSRGDVK